jgi:hypothetical protein
VIRTQLALVRTVKRRGQLGVDPAACDQPFQLGGALGVIRHHLHGKSLLATGLRSDNRKRDNSVLALASLLAVTAIAVACAKSLGSGKGDRNTAVTDYGNRSGYPRGVGAARGAARNFKVPEDMRIPRLLRPFA